MKKCVFAGTFDPLTLGHKDVVDKCLELFDEVVVAILINHEKHELFTLKERLEMLNAVYGNNDRVKILSWDGLLVDLLKEEKTKIYVRGVRNSVDYGYETLMHYTNAEMNPEMITIFIPTDQNHLHVSGSAVRTLLQFNKNVDKYLPDEIKELVKKYTQKK